MLNFGTKLVGQSLEKAVRLASRTLFRSPEFLFYRFNAQRPEYARLDPKLATLCYLNEYSSNLDKLTLQEFRKRFSTLHPSLSPRSHGKVGLEKKLVPTSDGSYIELSIYRPANAPSDGLQPGIVYLHGGGFVVGDQVAYDAILKRLAHALRQAVIFVDYRCAPEFPYPRPLLDCWDAYQWLQSSASKLGLSASQLGLVGDSAGANLCVGICRKLLAAKATTPAYQALIYPWLDLRLEQDSIRRYQSGFILTARMLRWFREQYLGPEEDVNDPDVSPALAKTAEGLPRTLIYAAEFDPLVDEAASFAAALRRAGVSVEYHKFERLVHGFLGFSGVIRPAAEAFSHIIDDLRHQSSFAVKKHAT